MKRAGAKTGAISALAAAAGFGLWLWLLSGCGTKVDTGDNLEKGGQPSMAAGEDDPDGGGIGPGDDPDAPILNRDDADATGIPTGSGQRPGTGTTAGGDNSSGDSAGPDSGQDAGSDSGSSSGGTLTCYGPAPQITEPFQAFCALPDGSEKSLHPEALQLVCTDQRLINLAYDACAWSGSGDSARYRKAMQRTALDDSSTTVFSAVMAYSITTPLEPAAIVDLITLEMRDPAYRDRYTSIRNSRIWNVVPVTNGFEYSAELANSAATVSFRARITVIPLGPDAYLVSDHAIGDKVLIEDHRYLRFVFRSANGGSRIIGVDVKAIQDGGSHTLAWQTILDVLRQRMERDLTNAQIYP